MGPISSTTGSTYKMGGIGMGQEEKNRRKRAGKEEGEDGDM